jgi:hypothetical protein
LFFHDGIPLIVLRDFCLYATTHSQEGDHPLLLLNRSLIGENIASHLPTLQLAAPGALLTNWLAPLGVGIFLADRQPRDRQTRFAALLDRSLLSMEWPVSRLCSAWPSWFSSRFPSF